jgi:hypothetical protein
MGFSLCVRRQPDFLNCLLRRGILFFETRNWVESLQMRCDSSTERSPKVNRFTAADVEATLRERGLAAEIPTVAQDWMTSAAELLGPQVENRQGLADLLRLIFDYDAAGLLRATVNHSVLAREGAREVVRELAHLVLEGGEIDSDRYKEIIATLKEKLPHRGRELFYPVRLALAGRTGEGELDRVILLLDPAARLPFATPVKGTRQRMLEFCSALD